MSFSDQESPPLGSTTAAAMRINPVQIDLKGAVKKAISKNDFKELKSKILNEKRCKK